MQRNLSRQELPCSDTSIHRQFAALQRHQPEPGNSWPGKHNGVVGIHFGLCMSQRCRRGCAHVLNPAYLPTSGIPGLAGDRYLMVYTSYAGCFGSLNTRALPTESTNCFVASQKIAQNDGCFNDRSPIRFASVTDGLCQTICGAERTNFIDQFDKYGWYVTGNLGDTLFTALDPPNLFDAAGSGQPVPGSASSFHPGGLNVLMCDASARFIKSSIQSWQFDLLRLRPAGATINPGGWWENLPTPGVWQHLATRAGNEIVSADDY